MQLLEQLGESVLVCRSDQFDYVKRLLQTKIAPTNSRTAKRHRFKLIIEAVTSGLCRIRNDLNELLELNYFGSDTPLDQMLDWLTINNLIVTQNDQLAATQLGRAVFMSSLQPEIALKIYGDLECAMRSLSLDTELHLLYLVTPLNSESIWSNYIDWDVYHNKWSKLPNPLKRVGKMIGISDAFIVAQIGGQLCNNFKLLQTHLRFLSALALYELIRERPLNAVANGYHINRGALQTLQQQSASYACMIVSFCKHLGWTYLRDVLDGFSERLAFGIRRDLTGLVQLDGIDGTRARAFYDAQVTSVASLAALSVEQVVKILRSVVPFHRRKAKDGLNQWLAGEQPMIDHEAAKILIKRAQSVVQSSLRSLGMFSDEQLDVLFAKLSNSQAFELSSTEQSEANIYSNATALSESMCLIEEGGGKLIDQSGDLFNSNLDDLSASSAEDTKSTQPYTGLVTSQRSLDDIQISLAKCVEQSHFFGDVSQNSVIIGDVSDCVASRCNNATMSDQSLLLAAITQPITEQINQTLSDAELLLQMMDSDGVPTSGLRRASDDHLSVDEHSYKSFVANPMMCSTPVSDTTVGCGELRLSQLSTPNHPTSAADRNQKPMVTPDRNRTNEQQQPSKVSRSSASSSRDLFESSDQSAKVSPILKFVDDSRLHRRRRCTSELSPLAAEWSSPAAKVQKFSSPILSLNFRLMNGEASDDRKKPTPAVPSAAAATLNFRDITYNKQEWSNSLVQIKKFTELGVCVATDKHHHPVGVAFCSMTGDLFYLKLKQDSGNETEWLSNGEKLDALLSVLASGQIKYIYDLLGTVRLVRALLESAGIRNICRVQNCVCLQTVAFLAHYRSVDGDCALSFMNLLSRLTSSVRSKNMRNLSAQAYATTCAYVCANISHDLLLAAIKLSTYLSVELELKFIILLTRIGTIGIGFDLESAKIVIEKLKNRLTSIESEAHALVGVSFNFDSPKEVSQILFDHLKIEPPKNVCSNTRKHHTTNKSVLKKLVSKHAVVKMILEWRAINTALTPSLPSFISNCTSSKRIHSVFNAHSATGRVQTAHPNVQSAQKDIIVDSISMRSLFVAPEGRLLIAADYRQLEMRVLAHLSADPQLIKAFHGDGDFFQKIANRWNSCGIDGDRNRIKQLCYGILYGMGAASLGNELGIQKHEAQLLIDSFFKQFPKVRSWMDETLAKCRSDGVVETLYGRTRSLSDIKSSNQSEKSRAERQAINTCIQGSASEIFKLALLNLHERLRDSCSFIVMEIHDEVLIETSEELLQWTVKTVHDCMTDVVPKFLVPLLVKVSSGRSWGDLIECI